MENPLTSQGIPNMERQSMNERSTNQKERAANVRKASRLADEQKNPCLNEQELSYKCLGENDYDKDQCAKSFQNYKNCKAFWSAVMRERRHNGIKPVLPLLKDRDGIRKESFKFPQNYNPI